MASQGGFQSSHCSGYLSWAATPKSANDRTRVLRPSTMEFRSQTHIRCFYVSAGIWTDDHWNALDRTVEQGDVSASRNSLYLPHRDGKTRV
ncbi:unnamed protein product [Protopolystoma xenopodis]|uniref:Uncharacterized protein n=1 Tax=Protopolystoma xenopodis TaxID=117903 RepID=A0A448XE18_9PLAT|nr:unnamed protein product [Protopolystoma xenopodis]